MPDSESRRRRELECLRLASDLMQLAVGVSNPDLKARFIRSAKIWSDQAEQAPLEGVAVRHPSHH